MCSKIEKYDLCIVQVAFYSKTGQACFRAFTFGDLRRFLVPESWGLRGIHPAEKYKQKL